MPEPFDIAVTRRVGTDCTVAFEGRTYSVPFALVGRRVEVRVCARHVQVLAGADIVAAHPRATAHRIVLNPGHFQGDSAEPVIAPAPWGAWARESQRSWLSRRRSAAGLVHGAR